MQIVKYYAENTENMSEEHQAYDSKMSIDYHLIMHPSMLSPPGVHKNKVGDLTI